MAGAVSPQSQPLILTPSFIHSFAHPLRPHPQGVPVGSALCWVPRMVWIQTRVCLPDSETHQPGRRQISSSLCPHGFSSFHGLPWVLLSFVAGPVPPSARPSSAASRRGLMQAEHAGFGEQSRVWFQHLIQFVLPRLKYEMVASQTFKGRRRESERLLKFKF